MSRALWKGSISFGLVSIPVELHTAVRDRRPRFRMLHAKDKSPVRFERVCIRDGHRVAWEDLVKGYEYEKGRFVVLTKEDFKAAALEKRCRLDILSFVEKYTDDYRDNLMRVIKARMKGERLRLKGAEAPPNAEVVDLMERLRQSLEGAHKAKSAPRKTTRSSSRTRRTHRAA